jgi:hypothetical protein
MLLERLMACAVGDGTAEAVDLPRIWAAHRFQQYAFTQLRISGQIAFQKKQAFAGAAAHDGAGHRELVHAV